MALRLFPFFCPWKTLLHHHQKATHLLPPPSCWWPSMQMTFSQVACATTRSELFSKDNISVAMLFPSNFKDFATKICFVNRIWILLTVLKLSLRAELVSKSIESLAQHLFLWLIWDCLEFKICHVTYLDRMSLNANFLFCLLKILITYH